MKNTTFISIVFTMLMQITIVKANDSKVFFNESFSELKNMLEEKQTISFERAIFISENPYWDNQYRYEDFQEAIEAHLCLINMLKNVNDKADEMDFSVKIAPNQRYDINMLAFTEQEKKDMYEKTLSNWAIFQYMTDTTTFYNYNHLPYTYQFNDPFGMANWKHSQVTNLLSSKDQSGNCFALVSLYKILADRLKSDAYICTAPQHIYIQHQDHKGDYYNVELATATHPGDGTIQTLTYTFYDGIASGISLRKLKEEKQNIALCLLHLAKSYEHKYQTKHDDFLLQCAELALQYDALNLNAMLLKTQVLEERILQYATQQNITEIESLRNDKAIAITFEKLEKQIVQLYELGYYQMPMYMQQMILAGLQRKENETVWVQDRTPNPLPNAKTAVDDDKRYSTLSRGLYEEVKVKKQLEQYGKFILNTTTKKIESLESESNFQFLIDPVVFAWSVDPLAHKFPQWSPYAAMGNNPILFVDTDGRENYIYLLALPSSKTALTNEDAEKIRAEATQNFRNMGLKTKVKIVDARGFDISKIDNTDAVAVIGDRNDVVNYVSNNLNKDFGKELSEDWEGGGENPEHSMNKGGNGNIIAIDANALSGFAEVVGLADETEAKIKAGALTINHGAGHNAGQNHAEAGKNTISVIMNSAENIKKVLSKPNSSYPTYSDITNNEPIPFDKTERRNEQYVNAMKKRFSNNRAQDNYSLRKNK